MLYLIKVLPFMRALATKNYIKTLIIMLNIYRLLFENMIK